MDQIYPTSYMSCHLTLHIISYATSPSSTSLPLSLFTSPPPTESSSHLQSPLPLHLPSNKLKPTPRGSPWFTLHWTRRARRKGNREKQHTKSTIHHLWSACISPTCCISSPHTPAHTVSPTHSPPPATQFNGRYY